MSKAEERRRKRLSVRQYGWRISPPYRFDLVFTEEESRTLQDVETWESFSDQYGLEIEVFDQEGNSSFLESRLRAHRDLLEARETTERLCVWCDTSGVNIDPTPLQIFLQIISTVVYQTFPTKGWEDFEGLQDFEHLVVNQRRFIQAKQNARLVCARIRAAVYSMCAEPTEEEKPEVENRNIKLEAEKMPDGARELITYLKKRYPNPVMQGDFAHVPMKLPTFKSSKAKLFIKGFLDIGIGKGGKGFQLKPEIYQALSE